MCTILCISVSTYAVASHYKIDMAFILLSTYNNCRDVLEMTFQNKSHKVRDVVLGMTLTSQLLKRGSAMYVNVKIAYHGYMIMYTCTV